jgi:hypothetical protein
LNFETKREIRRVENKEKKKKQKEIIMDYVGVQKETAEKDPMRKVIVSTEFLFDDFITSLSFLKLNQNRETEDIKDHQ